jgi:hypothetical protein
MLITFPRPRMGLPAYLESCAKLTIALVQIIGRDFAKPCRNSVLSASRKRGI